MAHFSSFPRLTAWNVLWAECRPWRRWGLHTPAGRGEAGRGAGRVRHRPSRLPGAPGPAPVPEGTSFPSCRLGLCGRHVPWWPKYTPGARTVCCGVILTDGRTDPRRFCQRQKVPGSWDGGEVLPPIGGGASGQQRVAQEHGSEGWGTSQAKGTVLPGGANSAGPEAGAGGDPGGAGRTSRRGDVWRARREVRVESPVGAG